MAGQPTISRFFKPADRSKRDKRVVSLPIASCSSSREKSQNVDVVDLEDSSVDSTEKSDLGLEATAVGKRFPDVEKWSGMSTAKRRKQDLSGDSLGPRGARGKDGSRMKLDRLTPLDQQVKELKDANHDKLLVVRVGYKYKCFAQDAVIASSILQIKLIEGKLTFDGSNPQDSEHKQFAYCSFPDNRLHVHLERLVRHDLKVGVVEQSETSAIKKFSKDSNKSNVFVRQVTNVFTKATYGINNTFSSDSRRVLGDTCSIWGLHIVECGRRRMKVRLLSIALNTGDIVYDEFEDSELSTEQLDIRARYLEPKEVVYYEKLPTKVERLLSGRDCSFHLRGLPLESEDVNERLKEAQLSTEYSKLYNLLYEYLKEYSNEKLLLIPSSFKPFAAATYMLLSSNTLESLDIVSNDGGKGSLFWLLDHTRTSFGSRILKEWVLRPLLCRADIEDRLDAIECLKEEVSTVFFEALNQILKSTSDLQRTLNRIAYGNTSRNEVYFFLKQISKLGSHFEMHSNDLKSRISIDGGRINRKSRLLTRLISEMMEYSHRMTMPLLFSMINASAVMEKDVERQTTEFFNLNNYDHPEVIIQRQREINSVQEELAEELNRIRTILKRPHLNYKDETDYLIEVRNTQVKGLPADWIKVNCTKMISRFHTPNIIRLMEKLQYHKDLLLRDAENEYKSFLSRIVEEYAALRNYISNIGIYDSLLALAATSCNGNYVRPKFTDKKQYIKAINARNPVIESLDVQYVPNDVNMSEKDGKVLILTGPNMGGKSSYVRKVALLVILAQIGSFVPADFLELGLFDNVFTRIGAFDNILRGESTFKIEMQEILQIIRNCSSDSLILLDEVGRGTGTEDGKAIAYTILEFFLAEPKCPLVLFTTHYTLLGLTQSPLLSNFYMDYVEEKRAGENWPTVVFLYKLRPGTTSNSFGLNVAKLAHIDTTIINSAFEVSERLREEYSLTRYTSRASHMKEILSSHTSSCVQKVTELLSWIEQEEFDRE
ncbi:hypothetical protein HG536_0A09460 [Torulaspora globosa]|uniref:DNA mismatch repair protein MSH3 n=1 Tax=Torulaspora globosa TaxID=48254 RepID=A0A7G3ZC93_9SACH|nr:uncharacterized protein HG536_0A09460 [Torulaspora globosa]QLL31129.1 hypothetical protein HG536_0A09460 [Torulaspora globosa]